MNYYKPTTIEENYSNIQQLQHNFLNDINSFVWEFNDIFQKYLNEFQYNQAIMQGRINPYCNGYENEIRMLAYKIHGYTSNVFETLAYALDFWRKQADTKQKNRNITDKEYDQAINLLAKKDKKIRSDKEALLSFRKERNYNTHYGRLTFCQYIFNTTYPLYNLIYVVCQLLGQMNMNAYLVSEFQNQQGDYIENMKEVLLLFSIDNPNVA